MCRRLMENLRPMLGYLELFNWNLWPPPTHPPPQKREEKKARQITINSKFDGDLWFVTDAFNSHEGNRVV